MWEKYHYIGCFFATEDFYKKVKKYRKNPLEQQIEIPHITFSYKPDKVEESRNSGQCMDYRIWK